MVCSLNSKQILGFIPMALAGTCRLGFGSLGGLRSEIYFSSGFHFSIFLGFRVWAVFTSTTSSTQCAPCKTFAVELQAEPRCAFTGIFSCRTTWCLATTSDSPSGAPFRWSRWRCFGSRWHGSLHLGYVSLLMVCSQEFVSVPQEILFELLGSLWSKYVRNLTL